MKLLQKLFQISKPFIRDISRYHVSFWFSTKCFLYLFVNIWTFKDTFSQVICIDEFMTKTSFMFIFFYHFLLEKTKSKVLIFTNSWAFIHSQSICYYYSYRWNGSLCGFFPSTFCMSLLVQKITYQFLQWVFFYFIISECIYFVFADIYVCVCTHTHHLAHIST